MKIDGQFMTGATPQRMVEQAVAAEQRGYDGWFSTDSAHDPFLPLAIAASRTERIDLGTAVAVAFARNPMTVAYTANDLQLLSGGRFVLGLGSQVKAHITKRFSMPWSAPAPRMREFVLALQAIWTAWNSGERLRFEGEFYRHTLMNPGFAPAPNPYGPPPVYLAALGQKISEVAGEVADGVILHPFTTPAYLREITWPAIDRGLERSGRDRSAIKVVLPTFAAIADDDAVLDERRRATAKQIAFYGSTPAYAPVLDVEGHHDVFEALHHGSRNGAWDTMGELITDDLLARFAAIGSADEVATQIRSRFGDLVDRTSLYTPYPVDDDELDAVRVALAG